VAKYGRGLNREVVAAVNRGELAEPLTTDTVRQLAASWPSPTPRATTIARRTGSTSGPWDVAVTVCATSTEG
jgi:hypothetical protein